MRTIDATNGEAEYVTATVTERNGLDITAVTWTVKLVGDADTPDTDWQAADKVDNPSLSTAEVSLFVDAATPKGTYQALDIRATDSPEVIPLTAATGSYNRIQVT